MSKKVIIGGADADAILERILAKGRAARGLPEFDEPDDDSGDDVDSLSTAMQELSDALKQNDPDAMARAFRAALEIVVHEVG